MANQKVEVKISLEVLNALVPNKSMLNAKASDLEGQKFVLHSMVVSPSPDKKARNKELMKAGDDTNFIKARYVNESNSKAFLVPIRGLLGMKIVEAGAKNAKFDPDTTPTKQLADYLVEKATDSTPATLPPSFTVVNVAPRIQESTGAIMYPPYCYQEFQDKVDELRKDDKDASLDPIYQDIAFMSSLYSNAVSSRFSSTEPNKTITISL